MDTKTQVLKDAKHLGDFIEDNELIRVGNLYELDDDTYEQYEEAIWYSSETHKFYRYGETSNCMESFGDYFRSEDVQQGNIVWAAEVARDMGYNFLFMKKLKELSHTGVIEATAKQFHTVGVFS